MGKFLIEFNHPSEAIPKLLKHYTLHLRVGICMSMTGSTTLKTGCGKSLTAAGLANSVDPYFTIKERVGVSPAEFLTGIDSFTKNTRGGEIIPSQAVVMDEGEIAAPSSLWFSFTNRAIFYTLATFRNTRGIAIIITPSLKWIDSRMRTLMAFWASTDKEYSPVEKKCHVSMRLYKITTDMMGDKMFYNKIRMWDNVHKRVVIFKNFDVKLPDPAMVAEYEEKSARFKNALRKDLAQDVAKFEKITSYRGEGKDEPVQLETIAAKLADDFEFRTLLSGKAGSRFRGFSVNALRAALESKKIYLKLGESELLRKILLKEWQGRKYADD